MEKSKNPSSEDSDKRLDLTCKFCSKTFARESTFLVHKCVKKQRFADANTTGSRIGFQAFKKFYKKSTIVKKEQTFEDFINSSYYIAFAKLGNHIASIKPPSVEHYIDYILDSNVKPKDWATDLMYQVYIIDMVKNEESTSAATRSIEKIVEWCSEHSVEVKDFFSAVSPNEAAHMIRYGHLSPWVLYLCSTGDNLLTRFNEEHASMISDFLYPPFWKSKFVRFKDDAAFISEMLEALEL